MTEVDYQLALLLQHKLEQEHKDSQVAKTLQQQYEREYESKKKREQDEINLNDSILARNLQEQFRTEVEVERPGNNLVYGGSSSSRTNTKSLTDPSWEVIDPTPDIHSLFIAFNERFFWNQLGSVCVCWSKRMTTCAGICTYQGRGGMCTIALSEPLLKLRPRKDLVETLLHEMIHAYLFVTNNNRDRDGHGPEFHRHMHRINSEAGTNITVYHNFHDEVRLYQQHWWKCTGPCKNRGPYFGMVRRAMNRAPGPTDRWWAEHSQNCGGQFIKVKEPEKMAKPDKTVKPQPDSSKNLADIRKFFSPTKTSNKSGTDNVKTISNNNPTPVHKVIPNSDNIFGFTNLKGKGNKNGGGGTMTKNNSSTIVVNKKNSNNVKDKPNLTQTKTDKKPTQSLPGRKLSSETTPNPEYSVVRNHWINKFQKTDQNLNNSTATTSKTVSSTKDSNLKRGSLDLVSSKQKLPKLSVPCPNCAQDIPEHEINVHLDDCLSSCETKKHTSLSSDDQDSSDDVFIIDNDSPNDDVTQCDVCQKIIPAQEYGVHVNQCLHGMFDKIEEGLGIRSNKEVKTESDTTTECLACKKKILKSDLNDHLEECMNLSSVFDDENEVEEGFDSSNTKEIKNESDMETECLACKKKILKSNLNDHLEECMNLSSIFDDENEPVEGSTDKDGVQEEVRKKDDNKFNCPVCMKLVDEKEMNDHIDVCLNI